VSDQNDFNIEDELLGAIDELLEQVEEQKRTREPDQSNAMLDGPLDDGGEVAEPLAPSPEPKSDDLEQDTPDNEAQSEALNEDAPSAAPEHESTQESEEATEPTPDPAQDALDAIEQVESNAESLLEESLDALLEDVENNTPEEQDDPGSNDPEDSSSETEPDPEPEIASEPADDSEEAQVDPQPEPTDSDEPSEPESESEPTEPEAKIETEPEAEAEPEPTPDDDVSLDDAIDAMLGENRSQDDSLQTPPEEEAANDPSETDEPVLEHDDEPEAQAADPELAGSIDSSMDQLDEALAGAAEEIIDSAAQPSDSELVDEDPDSSAASAVVEAIIQEEDEDALIEDAASSIDDDLNLDDALDQALEGTSEPPSASPDDAAPDPDPTPEPAPAAAVAEAPQDEPDPTDSELGITVPAWFVRFVEIVRPKLDNIDPRKGKSVDLLAQGIGWTLGAIWFYTPKYAFKVSSIISKPIDKQPPQIRAAIGYVGLWTLMLALVVWFYAMFVRTPIVPEPSEAPTRVLDESPDTTHAASQDL